MFLAASRGHRHGHARKARTDAQRATKYWHRSWEMTKSQNNLELNSRIAAVADQQQQQQQTQPWSRRFDHDITNIQRTTSITTSATISVYYKFNQTRRRLNIRTDTTGRPNNNNNNDNNKLRVCFADLCRWTWGLHSAERLLTQCVCITLEKTELLPRSDWDRSLRTPVGMGELRLRRPDDAIGIGIPPPC